jgi:uncharacterized protein (DUF2141 family)
MKKLFSCFLVVSLIFACQPENESPVIVSLTLTSTNIQKAEGAFLEFMYEFSDDSGLNQFRASVLDNFVDARLQSAPWDFQKDYDLSGTSVTDTLQIPLPYPDLEPGRYELTITLQDIDGDESAQKSTFYIVE